MGEKIDNYGSTLLIKITPEMKGAFQGLCKVRGVSVSAELRRFIADQLNAAAGDMGTPKDIDDPRFSNPATCIAPSNGDKSPDGDNEPDLFDDEQNFVTRAFNKNYGHLHKNALRDPLQVKSEPFRLTSSAVKTPKVRNKSKKR